jgi:hypothetical protein
MAKHRPRLTPQLAKELCERIKAGAFEHVASESLGIPVDVYQRWLARGRGPQASRTYREFYEGIQQAKAHARLMAEMAMRTDNPRTWLLHGPGKETASTAGWSASPRAALAKSSAQQQRAELLAVIAVVYRALQPFTDARLAVAQELDRFKFGEEPS